MFTKQATDPVTFPACAALFVLCPFLTLMFLLPMNDREVIFRRKRETTLVTTHVASLFSYLNG
jgi:hypothetical protein